ncbi:MAG: methyltransferase domain-containing protein [Pyrinomonadaceae bacterium]|nr:methyltransferase domain-containing protein [Pyrinomonadaceae bacterium]
MNNWLRENLVCPRDKKELQLENNRLICPENHIYPVVDDVPVMLLEETEPNHHYITETLEGVAGDQFSGEMKIGAAMPDGEAVDAFVQDEVPHTCGNLYFPIRYKLNRYPIPELRLPPGDGARFLDVGCNWGRWTVAAALKGYQPVGIDPCLKAVNAARKVSRQMNAATDFVVADTRSLPFADGCFDVAFSYLVLQSFSKENACISLREIARAVKTGGKILIQMPNKYGARSFYQQARRGFSEGDNFDIRYWSPTELKKAFTENFGKTEMSADCFFGLGLQKNDLDLLPPRFKAVIHSSEFLRRVSLKMSWLVNVADSIYMESINRKN